MKNNARKTFNYLVANAISGAVVSRHRTAQLALRAWKSLEGSQTMVYCVKTLNGHTLISY